MNRVLILCMVFAGLVATIAVVCALVAGWSWLWAIPIYGLTGSLVLLAATLIVQPGNDRGKPKHHRSARFPEQLAVTN